MSLRSLANAAAARRPDVGMLNEVPHGLGEIAAAANTPPEKSLGDSPAATSVDTALNLLIGYIPTEIVTLYLAVMGVLQPADVSTNQTATTDATRSALSAVDSYQPEWLAFFFFLVATPLAFWAIYIGKLRAAGKPVARKTLPLWEPTAALIAFLAWAFAIPNSPFRSFEDWYSPAIAAIIALIISAVLGLAAPIFQRPLGSTTVARIDDQQPRPPVAH